MKNILQFFIPLGVIIAIGLIMMYIVKPGTDDKKLYIKCNGNTDKFEVYSGSQITFMEKDAACRLEIEIANVDRTYIKLNTPYLWRLNYHGEIDEEEAKNVNIIDAGNELILYSFDKKTKFTFEFK